MLRIHQNINGFGLAVIQRLCKTSVKKNLYWEIKDRVIEEAFDGYRMRKQNRKVKVYGTNSTKEVRARCIEILRERVMYHKDKFVAPILHHEMQAMEVKTNGKVEHSDNSHDDQVFSYLMGLLVWYDGKNLAENFHIMKNILRTDADEDLEEVEFEGLDSKKEQLDFNRMAIEDRDEKLEELNDTLEWLEHDQKSYTTTESMREAMQAEMYKNRTFILNNNANARQRLIDETGVDYVPYMNQGSPYIDLPTSIYSMDDDSDVFDDGYELTHSSSNLSGPNVVGNLANLYKKL